MTWTPRQSRMPGTSDGAPATAAIAGMQKRTRWGQPQGSVVDWGNPITRGLVCAITPTGSYVKGTQPVATTPAPIIATSKGLARSYSQSAAQVASTTGLNGVASGANVITMLSVASTGASSGGSRIDLQIGNANGNYWHIGHGFNAATFTALSSGSSANASLTSGAYSPNQMCVAIFVERSNVDRSLFVNGVVAQSNTTSVGSHSAGNILTVGHANSNNMVALTAAWNRALSDAEIASLSANPYQIFAAPSSCVWVAA